MTKQAKQKILIVDDDLAFRVGTVALLEDRGYAATTAANGEEAIQRLTEQQCDLVLSDLVMPGVNGIELLKHMHARYPGVPVIMVTGFASIGTAVEAMRTGAYDYVTKPCDNDQLVMKIQRALDEQQKDRELKILREEVREVYSFENIIGRNSKMKDVYRLVRQVAGTDVPALILGETGTGKELVAKSVHYNSSRRDKPFVVINCSALAETLLESELSDTKRAHSPEPSDSASASLKRRRGGPFSWMRSAKCHCISKPSCFAFSRRREIQRVGGSETIAVDIRVVAATNRDLSSMIASGQFREDLFYRLNVFPIQIPPLRERLDDLPLLVDHLLKRHAGLSQNQEMKISPHVFPAMMNYRWKGNIRELENLLRRAILKTAGGHHRLA